MRRIAVIFAIFIVIASSCGKQTAKEDNFGNRENPLFGKIYQDIVDISELSHWQRQGGAVLYAGKNEDDSFRFAIEQFKNEDDDIILVFVEFVQHDEKGRNPNRKILDTINIGKMKDIEFLTIGSCRLNAEQDCEIIAVVVFENKKYLHNIVRAWRANTNTGRFEVVDVEGIDCKNEGYGI
jgi:hypothetical protein